MKILRVISSTNPEKGGPIEGIKQSQSILGDMGVKTEIACCDAPDAPWLKDTRLPLVHALGPAAGNYGYTGKLTNWLRENHSNFDAVIIHGLWQFHGLAVHRALAGTKTPYFVFPHGMLDPWFKRTYPLKHLKKWLYWPWAEYRVLRDAQAVIFTCEDERLLARDSFWLYKANEMVTAYGTSSPPQDEEKLRQDFLSKYPALRDKRLILFLSRIHEKKGCDLLINAFAKVAGLDENLHLVIAGPDQTGWKAELLKQAEHLGISHRITWPGMLQGYDKWGAYYAAEVFCLPSHQENFGIVVAEALACGKPVLLSNKVNIWREIEQDKSGFIAEDTAEGTETNLKSWLALSEPEYKAMCTRAKNSFLSRFHIDRAAERLIEIIKSTTPIGNSKNTHAAT
ncbi:glycosyltransferase [Stutzerimonas stutzeri]|uniref:glycosyltransferase n=1 Tax=Stutzerimonas stutzeri TaxID=316 RepID=UPI0024B7E326|nr:glycosyltransferase [Stutzerimonas stutzeri]MDI9728294.1 glycosyltransferase [Stutzerimonas stutzeri]MDI9749134.1 glycosyltransferase [Stutzerimonas stutzeri]